MKCLERENLIAQYISSLPEPEHQWDNIAVTSKEEQYICRHCLERKTVKLNEQGDVS